MARGLPAVGQPCPRVPAGVSRRGPPRPGRAGSAGRWALHGAQAAPSPARPRTCCRRARPPRGEGGEGGGPADPAGASGGQRKKKVATPVPLAVAAAGGQRPHTRSRRRVPFDPRLMRLPAWGVSPPPLPPSLSTATPDNRCASAHDAPVGIGLYFFPAAPPPRQAAGVSASLLLRLAAIAGGGGSSASHNQPGDEGGGGRETSGDATPATPPPPRGGQRTHHHHAPTCPRRRGGRRASPRPTATFPPTPQPDRGGWCAPPRPSRPHAAPRHEAPPSGETHTVGRVGGGGRGAREEEADARVWEVGGGRDQPYSRWPRWPRRGGGRRHGAGGGTRGPHTQRWAPSRAPPPTPDTGPAVHPAPHHTVDGRRTPHFSGATGAQRRRPLSPTSVSTAGEGWRAAGCQSSNPPPPQAPPRMGGGVGGLGAGVPRITGGVGPSRASSISRRTSHPSSPRTPPIRIRILRHPRADDGQRRLPPQPQPKCPTRRAGKTNRHTNAARCAARPVLPPPSHHPQRTHGGAEQGRVAAHRAATVANLRVTAPSVATAAT